MRVDRMVRDALLLAILVLCAPGGHCDATSEEPVTEGLLGAAAGQSPGVLEDDALADTAASEIAGYTDQPSVERGQTLTFMISVRSGGQYTLRFYRIGHYDGRGAQLQATVGPLTGVNQAACPLNPTTGTVECRWNRSYTLEVPDAWTSGLYVAVLNSDGKSRHRIPFVVRDDKHRADVLFQHPTFTYAAANCWPCGQSGKSLYDANSAAQWNTVAGSARAVKVSMDRPSQQAEGQSLPGGIGDSAGELALVRWLDREGYAVNYVTDLDMHVNGSRLMDYKAWVGVGSEMYWSQNMLNGLAHAASRGIGLAFFGRQAWPWQVRLEAASNGKRLRVIACYKSANTDPLGDVVLKTVRWTQASAVHRGMGNWAFLGIGADSMDTIVQPPSEFPGPPQVCPFIESDRAYSYAGLGLPLIDAARCSVRYRLPASGRFAETASIDVSLRQGHGGGWVFATGDIGWAWGLGRSGYADPEVRRLSRMALNAMLNRLISP